MKSKIGNWYEDMVMDETKFKDYLALKESKSLLVSKKEEKYTKMLEQIQIEPLQNGYLTTGSYFMLKNMQTNGSMVIDVDDKNLNYTAAFAVTTSPLMNFPCARSLFKMEKYSDRKESTPMNTKSEQKQIINYGDNICIMAYPTMYPQPLYLHSCLLSPLSFSRFSRNQEVLVNIDQSYNNCWTIEHPDQNIRFSLVGKPIKADQPFIIRHCATRTCLASDLVDYFNDYGHEYEISCKNFLTTNKYQQIEAEKGGRLRVDSQTRQEQGQNIWYVVDHI